MMMSDEEFLGAPAPTQGVVGKLKALVGETKAAPQEGLSDEAFLGGPDKIDLSAIDQTSFWGQTKSVAKDVAGYAAGAVGQIEDMLLTVPRALSIPGSWGVAASAAAKGESPKIAGAAALEYQEQFLPEPMKGPFGKIAKALGPESQAYYENNGVGWLMKIFGEGVEEGSAAVEKKTGIPVEYTQLLANQAMDLLGLKGTKAAVKGAVKSRGAAEEARQSAAFAERQAARPEPVVEEVAPALEEAGPPLTKGQKKAAAAAETKAIAERKAAVKEITIESPEQVKAIFDEALRQPEEAGMVVDRGQLKGIFEGAKRPAEVAPEPFQPGEVPKTRISEGLPLDEAKSAAALDKLAKEPWNMTAAEKVVARGAVKVDEVGRLVDPEGKPLFRIGEKGGAQDLETFMATMGILSLSTAASLALWKFYRAHQNDKEWEEFNRIPDQPHDEPTDAPPGTGFGTQLAMGAAAMGAVKLKGGGVWTKGAVERLAQPLATKLANVPTDLPGVSATPGSPKVLWAERAVTNHLNRYFGAAEDPLNSIKIPMLGDEVTWGQVADKVVKSAKIPERLKMMREGKAMKGEDIWDVEKDVSGNTAAHFNALQSFISHMGDYAREFVPPEKLNQYDFVRLAKETLAQDAKQAAKMAKARASGEGTTLHKAYPDGMKWVEVKSEDALRNEGDVMGHCVGGYCEAVHAGESKIYSLRDAKGESHVTVEVEPARPAVQHKYNKLLTMAPERPNDSIIQIKGKQNRAPVAQYLPYVQDFVKSGKWGEVGDFANTGMWKGKTENLTSAEILERGEANSTLGLASQFNFKDLEYYRDGKYESAHPISKAIKKALGFEDAERLPGGHAPEEIIRPLGAERGSVDPKQLVAIAAASGGAALGAYVNAEVNNQPLRGAIYGALAGLAAGTPVGRKMFKAAVKSPDAALGLISTRLEGMAPELRVRQVQHELRVLQKIDQVNDRILPFIEEMKALPKDVSSVAARALLNGQPEVVKAIPQLSKVYPEVQRVLGEIEGSLKNLKRFGEGVTNYFPRIVSDLEGLKKHIGATFAEGVDKVLVEAEAKMIRAEGRSLTDIERSIVVNRYLFAADKSSFQPGYAKGRKVETITPEMQQFYEPPVETLLRYVSGAINDVEVAKYFGRDLASTKKGGKLYTDIDGSIGNLTADLLRKGKITQEQSLELRDILKARFEGGEKGMSTALAAARNITNTALLGNVASAATQVGDSLMTIYHQGTIPTLQALAEKLIGREKVTPKQLGLINHVAEELSEMGLTGRALHNTMKYSGFHAIDMFAKGLGLNASLINWGKKLGTESGRAQFWKDYGGAFGPETPRVMQELVGRQMSPEVELVAFSELSKMQPISKAEMPEMYLRHPNGRILYQLKTYMLKQADVVRRDAYQNIASGEPKRIMIGAKNLAALGAVYAFANVPGDMIKDFLSGREVDPFNTPKLVENVLQTFGINRYAQSRLTQGNVVGVVQDLITPPVRVFQDTGASIHSVLSGESNYKGAGYIPLFGRPFYDRYLGGNERREISEKKLSNQGKAKEDRETLSPEAKEYLLQKRMERKERELAR